MNEKRKTKSFRLRVPAPPNLCGRFPRKDHLQWPGSARVRCEKTNAPLFHFGCVLTRRTARWALPRTTSLHRRDQFLHIPPDRLRGGSWRCGEGTPEMAKHEKQKQKTKQKGPETFRCPGLCWRELGRYAPMRNLHPVAPDPRTCQRARGLRFAWHARSSGADSISTTACRTHRHTTTRARTPGPMRVECW